MTGTPSMASRNRARAVGAASVVAVVALVELLIMDRGRQALDDGKGAGGIPLAKLAHERKRQVPRHGRRQADDDVTDRRVFRLVDFPPCAVHLLEDAARVLEQAFAGLRWRGAASVAQQQVLPQLDLEAADLPADRRLRDTEQARGPAEAAKIDDIDEVLELLQVHGGVGSSIDAARDRPEYGAAAMPNQHSC